MSIHIGEGSRVHQRVAVVPQGAARGFLCGIWILAERRQPLLGKCTQCLPCELEFVVGWRSAEGKLMRANQLLVGRWISFGENAAGKMASQVINRCVIQEM